MGFLILYLSIAIPVVFLVTKFYTFSDTYTKWVYEMYIMGRK